VLGWSGTELEWSRTVLEGSRTESGLSGVGYEV
jgi:hypothetical protein